MKIIVDKGIKQFAELIPLLHGLDDLNIRYLEPFEITRNSLDDTEVLLIRSTTKINSDLLHNSAIKFIGSATAGFDHMDTKYLDQNDISWCYSPGCNSSSVVHYVMSSIGYLIESNFFDINDSVGIIGYGMIGSKLSNALNGIGIKNISYDPFLDLENLCCIEDIKKCKLISLHIPLTRNNAFPTIEMIDDIFLEKLEANILINTSRGEVVDESSLLKKNNLIYISDVWRNEPTPSKDIIDYSLISTPHIAGHSHDGKINGTINLLHEIFDYLGHDKDIKIANQKVIKRFFSLEHISNYPKKIGDYVKTFDVFEESNHFKNVCEKEKGNLSEKTFIKAKSQHIYRRDIIPK